MAALADNKKLPSKESTLFRSIVRFYETKQYKKGLKASDQILKKFPEHGETLAMKGLTLNCLNRKTEAYDFVRKGLRNDLRSHVCWHVYGLLYRSDRDYMEAIKCYRNALRIDPENMQILRDLALLQVQMRDLKGHTETRRQQLTLKPNNRNHWIGFALSHHLGGNFLMAINILDAYINTLEADRSPSYEDSEMMLYKNQLIEESGKIEEALKHLDEVDVWVRDKLFMKEKRGEYLIRLGRFDEAMETFHSLLKVNSENLAYHRCLQTAALKNGAFLLLKGVSLPSDQMEGMGEFCLSTEDIAALSELYCKLQESHPRSLVCRRIPLRFLPIGEFRSQLDLYLRRQLSKGVPALGSELKYFYDDPRKVSVIGDLINSYISSLESCGSFPGREEKELPSTKLWTYYLSAQHCDRLGNHGRALQHIDLCIAHTPTALDFYQRKARILKHAGDIQAAATLVDYARKLDLQDRYINNKATEYLLHADRVEDAYNTISLFTRHEGDPQAIILEMQCMWYELACGQSWLRQKQYGKALKRFTAIEKHFLDFQEDQFDFHSYCLRKMTLKAYLDMLRVVDGLHGHRFFTAAAKKIIMCYLELHDSPASFDTEKDGEERYANMTAADRKVAKAKARKEALKQKKKEQQEQKEKQEREEREKLEREKLANHANSKKKTAKKETPVDTDPNGDTLVAKPALTEAWRVYLLLQQQSPKDMEIYLLGFDIAWRKKKTLLCLQSLKRASSLRKTISPEVSRRLVVFAKAIGFEEANLSDANVYSLSSSPSARTALNPTLAQIVLEETRSMLGGKSLEVFSQEAFDAATALWKRKCQSEEHVEGRRTVDHQDPASALDALVTSATALAEVNSSLDSSVLSAVLDAVSSYEARSNGNSSQLNKLIDLHRKIEGSNLTNAGSLSSQLMRIGANLFPYARYFGNSYQLSLEPLESTSSVAPEIATAGH